MKKTVLMTATIASLAVNVFAADNNFIGGTDNTVTNNAKSVGVVGYQNTVGGNNAVAFGENNIAAGTNSFAGGNDSKALGRDSFAYGAHAEATVEYTVAIGSQARTAAYNTIAIGNGAYANGESTVVIGRTNTVNAENATVIGSNNGIISSGHGVVIGYNNQVLDNSKEQLAFGSNNKTKGQGAVVIGTHGQAGAIDALAIGNNTLADTPNAVALGTNSTTDTVISTDHIYINGKKFDFAGGVADSTVSVGTTNKAGMSGVMNYKRTITNVAAGRIDSTSTDAVNGSQLRAQNQVGMAQINQTNARLNKLGASSAALAGLHPLDFNRNDKASYAVSYGHYRNANAVALGAFYRPNERTMFGIGASLGGETQFTMNIAFKVGKGSDYVQEANDAQSRISKLEALVNQLVEEVNAQKGI